MNCDGAECESWAETYLLRLSWRCRVSLAWPEAASLRGILRTLGSEEPPHRTSGRSSGPCCTRHWLPHRNLRDLKIMKMLREFLLRECLELTYGRQLTGVVGVTVRSPRQSCSSWHCVQSLGQVGSSLEDHLLGQSLGVPGVAGNQLGQPGEPVVYARLLQSWNESV